MVDIKAGNFIAKIGNYTDKEVLVKIPCRSCEWHKAKIIIYKDEFYIMSNSKDISGKELPFNMLKDHNYKYSFVLNNIYDVSTYEFSIKTDETKDWFW